MTFRIVLVTALAMSAALAGPRIVYSKTFKGSTPESVTITVERDGQVTYREGPADSQPLEFRLIPADVGVLFTYAGRLDNFARPLESSKAKVANMGRKTFRYEDGATTHEVSFNYSEDPDARQLADLFERITETEERYLDLEHAIHFDRLGIDQAILQVRMLWDHHRLVAPEQFLTLLARISNNESLMHVDRARAASLAEEFRHGSPPEEETKSNQ